MSKMSSSSFVCFFVFSLLLSFRVCRHTVSAGGKGGGGVRVHELHSKAAASIHSLRRPLRLIAGRKIKKIKNKSPTIFAQKLFHISPLMPDPLRSPHAQMHAARLPLAHARTHTRSNSCSIDNITYSPNQRHHSNRCHCNLAP